MTSKIAQSSIIKLKSLIFIFGPIMDESCSLFISENGRSVQNENLFHLNMHIK